MVKEKKRRRKRRKRKKRKIKACAVQLVPLRQSSKESGTMHLRSLISYR